MEIKTVTYQCPNCSAALEYNNALGKFKCLFCDSEFTEEDIKKRFAENEGFELSQENLEAEQEAAQDESNRQAEEFAGASALYTCPNCGSHLRQPDRLDALPLLPHSGHTDRAALRRVQT